MGMCKECKEVYTPDKMENGLCFECIEKSKTVKLQSEKNKEIMENKELLETIFITTETMINQPLERVGFVSSQCVYGLNIVKDLFSSIRNIVGGRIQSIEESLQDATNTIIVDLKTQAYLNGCNAIIGLRIEHCYISSPNGNILSLYGTGTMVKI